MLCVSVLVFLLIGVLAQELKQGPCPYIRPVSYNPTAYLGWYEYKRSPHIRNNDERCIKSMMYEPQKGVYKVLNKFHVDSINSTMTTFGDLYLNDDNTYFTSIIPHVGPKNTHFRVLSIDKEHVIVWSCEDRGFQHIESGWVYTATPRTPSAEIDEKIRRSYAKFGLQVPEMYTHNLEECRQIFATY
ncbi:GSCOCG00006437001-RA-CDS [Cotesia congregata]|uniref:Uncharacterized protein n=1 Tax=Cotesia congregata TaxID=51543 RepID=A0A8J2HL96_COTCN|nr:GSCOCG00006437001-RA-CDS [Cotesia congregata]CAG5106195.1 Protein of unknown function [Cotesia congregata]